MNEFERWLDESSDASDVERAVLRSGLDADPPAAQEDAVWAGILGSLALTPLGAAAPSAALKVAATGTKATAVWLGVGKGFILGLALYGATAGVNEISEHLKPQPAQRADHAVVEPSTRTALGVVLHATQHAGPLEPASPPEIAIASSVASTRSAPPYASVEPENAPPPRASEAPSVAAFADAPPKSVDTNVQRSNQLEGEARALRMARSQLRSGQLAGAFATLEASRRQFSAPELDQEREALLIELLYRSGQIAVARDRAKAFSSRYPESPHAGHVRQFMTP
jgi:hypothetical protein